MSALPKETVDLIKAMRDAGISWPKIERTFSISYDRARGAIDPEYARARNLRNNLRKKEDRIGVVHDMHDRTRLKLADIEKRRKWQQRQDTRDLTAVMMGDPFPGRSALDRKKEGRAQS